MTRIINQKTIDLVKDFEGFYADEYICPAGVPTIGYGHTGGDIPVHISKEDAEEVLKKDLEEHSGYITDMVTVQLNDDQFGALVSLCFNIGPNKLKNDSIIQKLNTGDHEVAAGDFWMMRRAAGQILKGLQERRAAECHLFLTGDYFPRESGCYLPGAKHFYGNPDGSDIK